MARKDDGPDKNADEQRRKAEAARKELERKLKELQEKGGKFEPDV